MSQNPTNLAINHDDYIQSLMDEQKQALWCAKLSNGLTIIQDDGRPGMEIESAWIRLGEYCEENGVRIERLWLQFRTNHVDDLEPNAEGYFFSKSVIKTWDSVECLFSYVVGYLVGERVRVYRYSVPALICVDESWRDAKDMKESLIRNTNYGLPCSTC